MPALILGIAATWSCGGAGAPERPTLAELVGSYNGTWHQQEDGFTGTVSITVLSNGEITGSASHSQYGNSSRVGGEVGNGGRFDVFYIYPTSDPDVQIGNSHKNGRLRFVSPNLLVGTLKQNVGDFDVPVHYELTKQ